MRSHDGTTPGNGPGSLVRRLRDERWLSRETVAARVGVSVHDLDRFEAGLWVPGRSTLLRLAELFELSLRERNDLLGSAGHVPPYRETPLEAPRMAAFRDMIGSVLRGHGTVPAMAVDQSGRLLMANEAAALIVDAVAPLDRTLPTGGGLGSPIRPECLDTWARSSAEWTGHVLRHDLQQRHTAARHFSLLRVTVAGRALALVNVETVFALPLNVTVEEMTIHAFFPADSATAGFLRGSPC